MAVECWSFHSHEPQVAPKIVTQFHDERGALIEITGLKRIDERILGDYRNLTVSRQEGRPAEGRWESTVGQLLNGRGSEVSRSGSGAWLPFESPSGTVD